MEKINTSRNSSPNQSAEKKHKSTPEIVGNKIITQIESGALQPGQKLPTQSELAKVFKVGTSSIREAVNALELMGYLEVSHGRGMFVREELPINKSVVSDMENDLSNASAFELFELRELLECHFAEQAAKKIDAKGLDTIRQALERLKSSVGEKKAFIDADIEFHVAIAESVAYKAGASIIRMFHELMHKNFDLAVTAQTTPYGQDACYTAEQIVEHIADGNERLAARCMRSHLGLPKNAIVRFKITSKKE